MRDGRINCILILLFFVFIAGCASPYIKAENEYFKGNPDKAEEILKPVADKEKKKDGIEKNLYLWDLGVYFFAQSKYEEAIDCFMESVKDAERISKTGEQIKAAMTSASTQKYVGDPVEISMAYFYIGLSYFMMGDYSNALVGFKRSLEEDLSKDISRNGDMCTTNFMIGITYLLKDDYDNAIVALKRSIEYNKEFTPGYILLYNLFHRLGRIAEIPSIYNEIEKLEGKEFVSRFAENESRGVIVILMADKVPSVSADVFIGAFRKRNKSWTRAKYWKLAFNSDGEEIKLYLSDNLYHHFKDQGGLEEEIKHQTTRAIVSKAMSFVPIISAFAPDVSADTRYWRTLPGRIYTTFYPIQAGRYSISISAFDKKLKPLPKYYREWEDIEIGEDGYTLIVLTPFGICSKPWSNKIKM